jgi:2-polyprenyl-3-methyl-5-hydroxy-6-metoxy-1,4-benzoquinol methylase
MYYRVKIHGGETMDKPYWDGIAGGFEDAVFDVLGEDRKKVVLKYIDEFACSDSAAADYGCGVGRHLGMLAERFAFVEGIDFSGKCLQTARKRCAKLNNVSILKADLSSKNLKLRKVHFGLGVNLLIMPSLEKRAAILANITKHLYRGAHLVMVVPSLESVLFAQSRLVQWNIMDGLSSAQAVKESLGELSGPGACLPAGILRVGNTATKHYLEEELSLLCKEAGLRVLHIEKVTYLWRTEFVRPPNWMGEPYPWDWLAVCGKR